MVRRSDNTGTVSAYPRETAHKRGYNYQWKKARLSFLKKYPYCVKCREQGRLTPASVVDHIVPHKQDRNLFWDKTNWQPLCKPCHDSDKKREEHTPDRGCSADGIPNDPNHPWNSIT